MLRNYGESAYLCSRGKRDGENCIILIFNYVALPHSRIL